MEDYIMSDDAEWVTTVMTQNSTTEGWTTPFTIFPNRAHAVAVATLSIIIGVMGVAGNCLIFVAVLLSKKLQTVTNAFVVNLSVSDFLTAIVLPFQAVGLLAENGWPLADAICDTVAALGILTLSVSIIALAMIAINRHILITKSKTLYQRIYTRARIAMMIAFTWIFPFIFILVPQLIPSTGGLVYSTVYKACIWDLWHPLADIFQGLASLIFIISTIVIIFCYVAIYLFIRKHIAGTQTRLQIHASTENLQTDADNRQQSPANKAPSVKQVMITKNLCSVVVVFFICVVPHSVVLNSQQFLLPAAYLSLLFVLPSSINPILYAAKHPNFKVVFSCMWRCHYKDIPHPSNCLKSILRKSRTTSTSGQSGGSNYA